MHYPDHNINILKQMQRPPPSLSGKILTRVIGVYAYYGPGKVFRHGEACVVGGSEELMDKYMALLTPELAGGLKVSKIRSGAIYDGLQAGAAYAFDQVSYARFYLFARHIGIEDLVGFRERTADEFHFMKVTLDTSDSTQQ